MRIEILEVEKDDIIEIYGIKLIAETDQEFDNILDKFWKFGTIFNGFSRKNRFLEFCFNNKK